MRYDPIKEFDYIAPEYLIHREKYKNDVQLAFLSEKLHPVHSKTILELGCGGGAPVLKHFYDQGANIWGVDFSAKMLMNAKRNLPGSRLILTDICDITLPNNHFDAILSFYTLYNLPLEKQFVIFDKIKRALKPGGLTYFTLAGHALTQRKEFSGFLRFMNRKLYYAHTTPEEYVKKLEAMGFTGIACSELRIGEQKHLWILAQKTDDVLYSF